jgi:hypothetical protein
MLHWHHHDIQVVCMQKASHTLRTRSYGSHQAV